MKMAIDIENPGGDEAALKGALADLTGWAKISSGSFSSPVTSLNVALPAGYSRFHLVGAGILRSDGGSIIAAFSFDNGVSWEADVDADSYTHSGLEVTGVGGVAGFLYDDDVMYLNGGSLKEDEVVSFDIDISPAIAGKRTHARVGVLGTAPSSDFLRNELMNIRCNVTGRPTNIMLVPEFGNGDFPPTGLATFDDGEWLLLGIPSP